MMDQPINTSGLSTDTQLAAQPQPLETFGVTKALSILDKAQQLKTAGALNSPSLALKASRQVGTVSGIATGKGGSLTSKVPLIGKPKIKEPAMSKPKLKLSAASPSEGQLHQVKQVIRTKAENRAEADILFDGAPAARTKSQKDVAKLFVQTPGAETMSQMLVKGASISPNIDAFFEKVASRGELTEAQLRFPELLDIVHK